MNEQMESWLGLLVIIAIAFVAFVFFFKGRGALTTSITGADDSLSATSSIGTGGFAEKADNHAFDLRFDEKQPVFQKKLF